MKKLFSLFVPLMALFLTLSPQTAKAANYAYIKIDGTTSAYARFCPTLVGSWNDADVAALNFEYSTNGTNWYKADKVGTQNSDTKKYTVKKGSSEIGGLVNNSSSYTYYCRMAPTAEILAKMGPNKYFQIGINAQSKDSKITVEGNIMSMVYGKDCAGKTTIPSSYCFYRMFTYKTGKGAQATAGSTHINSVDFSGLELPATTLAKACYANMFTEMEGCLKLGPTELPAIELVDSCYAGMFSGCRPYTGTYQTKNNFTTAPVIKALSLQNCSGDVAACCKEMFYGCTALTTVTTHFLSWGSTDSPTENWLPSASWSGTIKCIDNTLTTKSGQSGTANATLSKTESVDAYIFDVATNGGSWGTCTNDSILTRAPKGTPTHATDAFLGWFTDPSAGSSVNLAGLPALDGVKKFYAHFGEEASYTVTIPSAPSHGTLVVKKDDTEIANSASKLVSDAYPAGTTVTLVATAAPGYRFKKWIGTDAESVSDVGTITLTDNVSINAEFEEDLCSVTLAVPAADGTLSAQSGLSSYTQGNTYTFNRQTDAGKEIIFSATPNTHRRFVSWTDANSLLTNKTAAPYSNDQVCTAKLTIALATPLEVTIGATFLNPTYTISASGANGHVTLSAKGNTVTGFGTFGIDTVVTMQAVPDVVNFRFDHWEDMPENTNATREVKVAGNANYTAVFVFDYTKEVSVEQTTTTNKTIIAYDLRSITGLDGKTYQPIDMGYGVAWADRNIGASGKNTAGEFYYWGGTTPDTYFIVTSGYAYNCGSNTVLPDGVDAAQVRIGASWYIPTKAEWEDLNNNCDMANYTYTNRTDDDASIFLPAGGAYMPTHSYTSSNAANSASDTESRYYWTKTLGQKSSQNYLTDLPYYYNQGTVKYGSNSLFTDCYGYAPYGMQVRAIYKPSYTIYTLTVNVGTHTYTYKCQSGQKVTVTVVADEENNYSFSEWSEDHITTNPRTFTVTGNMEYTAVFTETMTNHTVTITTPSNGTLAVEDESDNPVSNGDAVAHGSTLTLTATPDAGYKFGSWTNDAEASVTVNSDVTLGVTFAQKSYTLNATAGAGGSGVTRNDNGSSETVKHYNDAVVLTPVANTGYHFTGWTGTDADDLVDNEDGTYTLTIADKADNYEYAVTANFTPNTHRLTWTTDGNTLTGDYTHGEAIAYGTTVTAPDTPTKNATAEYTYTFSAWSPDVAGTMPDKDVEYTAIWTETKRRYTLTWDVNGGNALTGTYTNGTIDWGTDIVKPANPTRTDYTFGGWDADNNGTADKVAETMPTNSLTYKAIWVAELPDITLCENCDNDRYTALKTNYNGETVNVTYPRQFAANRWSTMCLPFSIELPEMITQKMYGRVYEFKYATGNANTNSGVNLYFSNAKKIEAGKCYIVNANDALAAKTSFVFSGVTIDLTKDNGADLSSPETPEASMAAYNALPGYKSEGTIELVGTLRNGTLHGTATGNKYMGLKDNKIYYPNISQGSTIWAYRGIFRSKETLNIEKMRIIVDGEDRGELIIDEDGELLNASGDAPSRKFIRDGVLYIEREGVVYDAQGKRVED